MQQNNQPIDPMFTKSKWTAVRISFKTLAQLDEITKATQRSSKTNVVEILVQDAYKKIKKVK